VEYRDVFANDGNCLIFHGFVDERGGFYKNEIIVQYVHDGIALFVQRKQM
jgi:hypothetical protein